ncbi:MAG: hypothetical protein V3S68_04545, partial [Dehalococcoidia bacterium]
ANATLIAVGDGVGVSISGVGVDVGTGRGVDVASAPHATASNPRVTRRAAKVFRAGRKRVIIHISSGFSVKQFWASGDYDVMMFTNGSARCGEICADRLGLKRPVSD